MPGLRVSGVGTASQCVRDDASGVEGVLARKSVYVTDGRGIWMKAFPWARFKYVFGNVYSKRARLKGPKKLTANRSKKASNHLLAACNLHFEELTR